MFICLLILIFSFGNLEARQMDIDINRIVLLPKDKSETEQHLKTHDRYQLNSPNYNDVDVGYFESNSLHSHEMTKPPIKVYQPKEDPKLFYQSDTYLNSVHERKMNEDISHIHLGNDVVYPEEKSFKENKRLLPLRMKHRGNNRNICIRCPNDRTLVAKPGSGQVLLQHPHLMSCSGHRAPRGARFLRMYGAKFGALIEQGTHTIVGRVVFKNKNLQMCKMQVNVLVQGCITPRYLVSNCDDGHKSCNFSCRNHKQELFGQSTLTCDKEMKWSGDLPICKVRTWCEPPQPPDHGRISCKGATAGSGPGLAERSRCRVICAHGWRWSPRTVSVCRRGSWTHNLTCQMKKPVP